MTKAASQAAFFLGSLDRAGIKLGFLARRIATAVEAAHPLGAFLITGLFLSAFIANDALILLFRRRFTFYRAPILFPGFLNQRPIAKHLPDDLFCLSLGLLLKFAHGGLLCKPSDAQPPRAAMFPFEPAKMQFLAFSTAAPSFLLLRPVPANVTNLSQSKTKRRQRQTAAMLLMGRT
jgi:hypothetical protein